ncbi:hypothetical protein AGABI2DRAFT_195620 [Agaricus bisporus var. bisporus H97]|uniref:hypothetical protein n=1 Tax=Agaricus bisporus var. bisporus (strain H97 / ATCC MYA-4626 / FGSC 10389) TaxID=936046 RepID=UPI00029F7CD4|nr:hypothetical protein AGABI2DRAFT_195620 [Agaricus bisporus var. bisporus H97]EKV42851.1 hypothetical protein AGABI2DRAFT_195620 [Agaricus bisporus var. bisporus H97]
MMNGTSTTHTQAVVPTLHMNTASSSRVLDDDVEKLTKVKGISSYSKPSVDCILNVNSSGDRKSLTLDNAARSSTVANLDDYDCCYGNGSTESRMLVSADGTEIYANAVGDPLKQAIVFIHGFVWSFMAFDDIFEDVEWMSRFYLVRYDVRGHGRSGKPEGDEAWEWKRFAEDFDAVVEAYGLHKPFVAGWSLGGCHLLDILTLHPVDYVAGIINIAGATYLDDTQLEKLATPEGRDYIHRMSVLPSVEDFQSGAKDFVDACCRTLPYEVRERCLGNIMIQPRSTMVHSLTRKQRVETFEMVGKTMLPCLLIFGDEDELIMIDELERQYREVWRNLTVEVVKGGCHVPWTKTQRDVAAVFSKKTLAWIDCVMQSQN